MNVVIVGAGYAGLVTAAGLAANGHRVVAVDKDSARVAAVAAARSPFHEPGLPDLLRRVIGDGSLRATGDLTAAVRAADAIFIAVPTPPGPDGAIELQPIEGAAAEIGCALRSSERYCVVAVKSTVVPGTTEDVVGPIVWEKAGRGPTQIGLGAHPEFLREGQAVNDVLDPDRIVIGAIDAHSTETLAALYAGTTAPLVKTTPRTAELIKYAGNAFLALLISYANEIAGICEVLPDVDVEEVMTGLHLDRRLTLRRNGEAIRPGILSYLQAGCGFGGSCLPKDVAALARFAQMHGAGSDLLDGTLKVNQGRSAFLVDRVEREVGPLRGRTIGVLGLAFKPDTDDVRGSPARPVIAALLDRGTQVKAYDPGVDERATAYFVGRAGAPCAICASAAEALADADAAIVVTAWAAFRALDWRALAETMRGDVVIDGRRILDDRKIRAAGLRYVPIGRR